MKKFESKEALLADKDEVMKMAVIFQLPVNSDTDILLNNGKGTLVHPRYREQVNEGVRVIDGKHIFEVSRAEVNEALKAFQKPVKDGNTRDIGNASEGFPEVPPVADKDDCGCGGKAKHAAADEDCGCKDEAPAEERIVFVDNFKIREDVEQDPAKYAEQAVEQLEKELLFKDLPVEEKLRRAGQPELADFIANTPESNFEKAKQGKKTKKDA